MTVRLRAPATEAVASAAPLAPVATDRLLDAAVGAFAVFTVLFHLASRFDWSVTLTAALWFLALPLVLVVVLRGPHGAVRPGGADVTPGPVAVVAAVAAVATGAAVAVGARLLDTPGWWAFWASVVVAELTAVVLVLRARPSPSPPSVVPVTRRATFMVVVAAIAFAAASAVTIRPDADDVFLVNRSVWIEERADRFPERDTIFSDEVFVATRPQNPPAAIEPLVGVLARATPFTAPTVTYLVLAPAVSALGVFALWRLLRALRSPTPALATAVGALFLALDGHVHTSFGNFGFVRAWQGKAIFLLVVVPLLWAYALAWARDHDRRSLAGLVAANVAAVGLTSTALFVAPAVTLLAVAAGTVGSRGPGRVLLGAASAAYPLAAGVLVAIGDAGAGGAVRLLAAGLHTQAGVPAPLGGVGGLGPADPWYAVLGRGVPMFVATAAVLLAWLTIRDRSARVALLLAPLAVVGIASAPGTLRVLGEAMGARSILWRVVWIVPVPAVVALMVTAPAQWVERRWRPAATAALVGVLAGALLLWGVPVWSGRNGTTVARPAWDVAPAARAAAAGIVTLAEPGDVVAAPVAVGEAMAVMSVDVRAVDPRTRDVVMRRKVPGFHAEERLFLASGVEVGIEDGQVGEFIAALDILGVGAACSRPVLDGTPVEQALTKAGFTEVARDDQCVYWRR